MLRLIVYAAIVLIAIGAIGAGAFPNSPASAVHDAIAGWHWIDHWLSHHPTFDR